MTEAFVSVNGVRVSDLELRVANVGPWFAELDLEQEITPSGPATITIDGLELVGTIEPRAAGAFGLRSKIRVIGGAGAWSKTIPAKGYHNDSGVKALNVAQDLARELGEELGVFTPTRDRLGKDFARPEGLAATVLEDIAGGAPWWVDYNGNTHVGQRPATTADVNAYEVLAYDPRSRLVTLSVSKPDSVVIGSILTERLDGPQTVRELALRITPDEMRVSAWCGGSEVAGGMLADLLRTIAKRALDGHLFGCYRYRVVRTNGDRVELQAASRDAGLPDLAPLSMWPGVAGVHAELAQGAEVLVEFIDGDRAQPIVTHFSGKDGVGFVPSSLTLGGPDGAPAARDGDTVEVLLPPALLSGTALIGGTPTPITGALTFMVGKALGVITSGSSKVKVAP